MEKPVEKVQHARKLVGGPEVDVAEVRNAAKSWSDALTQLDCDSAAEFMDALTSVYTSGEYGAPRADRWAFRGQNDSSWELVPSAFRPGTCICYQLPQHEIEVSRSNLAGWEQSNAEFFALYEFLHLADKVGLNVPGDSQVFRQNSSYENVVGRTIGTEDWPPATVLETLAIAQHHGVPTRLLDFSTRAGVAAFFAARGCSSRSKQREVGQTPGRIAVWGIDLDFIYVSWRRAESAALRIVTVPRARNPYLHAQHGMFLYDASFRDHRDPELNRTVGNMALSVWQHGVVDKAWKPMVKVTVPAACADEVTRMLELEGVDAPHLMPSFDTVVEELRRRRKLRAV